MTAHRKHIQQAHFDAAYSTTDDPGPGRLQHTVLALLKAFPVPEGCVVLDIGAGRGELLARLPDTCSTFAVDPSTAAAQQLVAQGLVVRRLAGDEILPFDDPFTRWVARRAPRVAHHLVAVCEIAP